MRPAEGRGGAAPASPQILWQTARAGEWEVSSIAVGGPPVLLQGLFGEGAGDEFQVQGPVLRSKSCPKLTHLPVSGPDCALRLGMALVPGHLGHVGSPVVQRILVGRGRDVLGR
jgi:hypothetical protein